MGLDLSRLIDQTGPLISVKPYDEVSVQWLNELPAQHILPLPNWSRDMIDCGINTNDCQNPAVRFVPHLHGGHSAADSDGHAEVILLERCSNRAVPALIFLFIFPEQAWWSNVSPLRGRLFSSNIYNYSNDQRPTLLLYHDHSLGTTALNVYAGLSGAYLIQDYDRERRTFPWLPSCSYQIPLILSDRNFEANGQLAWPM
jgi:spore coat protein A